MRAWLEIVKAPKQSVGERIELVDDGVPHRSRTGRLSVGPVAPFIPGKNARFVRVDGSASGWRLVESATPSTEVNGIVADRLEHHELHEGDHIVLFSDIEVRFTTSPAAPLPLVAGARRAGKWITFNPLRLGLVHALPVDGGAMASACVGRRAWVLDAPGTPRVLERVVDDGQRTHVIEDVAGVPYSDVLATMRARHDAPEPSLVVAASLALARCAAGGVVPERFHEVITFDGRVLCVSHPDSHVEEVDAGAWPQEHAAELNRWCCDVAADTVRAFGVPFKSYSIDRSEAARTRDHVESSPLADELRAMLGIIVDDAGLNALIGILERMRAKTGDPDARFLASVVADVAPDAVAREKALREEVALLGVDGLMALVPRT